jgi:hypothetical protein
MNLRDKLTLHTKPLMPPKEEGVFYNNHQKFAPLGVGPDESHHQIGMKEIPTGPP